ncbi:hypothetical protein K458DRAFT_81908 [Lentithecium fluviatile CBS 122367]|uniref:Uncharacterized protein n=1 Tax=Lentithecium fluviatile CBS 122367 TaxID=1168545 RepID=A0A6G1IU83_9PLEO|nr:hypothetical protein K458DRAFT_81908 [Lentithecium fluviatile CBS 122367]
MLQTGQLGATRGDGSHAWGEGTEGRRGGRWPVSSEHEASPKRPQTPGEAGAQHVPDECATLIAAISVDSAAVGRDPGGICISASAASPTALEHGFLEAFGWRGPIAAADALQRAPASRAPDRAWDRCIHAAGVAVEDLMPSTPPIGARGPLRQCGEWRVIRAFPTLSETTAPASIGPLPPTREAALSPSAIRRRSPTLGPAPSIVSCITLGCFCLARPLIMCTARCG